MGATAKSRYKTAVALEAMPKERRKGAVRFQAYGYSISRQEPRLNEPGKKVIRFAVDAGQAIEIALTNNVFKQLTGGAS